MTINELRARKQELLARKKYEMELQEQGQGDNFAAVYGERGIAGR